MKNPFRSIAAVLGSGVAQAAKAWQKRETGTNRVLKSTKLENRIYFDLRRGDEMMDGVEAACVTKLPTFPALAQDLFQGCYSLRVRPNSEDSLTASARKLNKHILDSVMEKPEYATLKAVCQGKELPSYDAAAEFSAQVANNLEHLLSEADAKAAETLEKLEQQRETVMERLNELLEQYDSTPEDDRTPSLEKHLIQAAGQAQSKEQQVNRVSKMLDDNARQGQAVTDAAITAALQAALAKASETAEVILAWGNDPSDPRQNEMNRELLAKVAASPKLQALTHQLGRMREMASKAERNGYRYGRGETYSLELGNNLQRTLSSEFALLALPGTAPLFARKYQQKALKQYRRREPVHKARGDIIFCRDESISTEGDAAAWGQALALTMLSIALRDGRKFALVHFDTEVDTDIFLPNEPFGSEEMLASVERFRGGGTSYEPPLQETVRLVQEAGFQNADVIFVTDGECGLSRTFLEEFQARQRALGFGLTGLLLDAGNTFSFSLEQFCKKIYRTSELTMDAVAEALIQSQI